MLLFTIYQEEVSLFIQFLLKLAEMCGVIKITWKKRRLFYRHNNRLGSTCGAVIPSLTWFKNYRAEKFWLRLHLTELLHTNKTNSLGEERKIILIQWIRTRSSCPFPMMFSYHILADTKIRAEYSDYKFVWCVVCRQTNQRLIGNDYLVLAANSTLKDEWTTLITLGVLFATFSALLMK